VLLLDFCKAFDKVPYLCLFQKLHHCGIWGTLFSWIEAFLTNWSQHVILENKQSTSLMFFLVYLRARFWGLCFSHCISMICPFMSQTKSLMMLYFILTFIFKMIIMLCKKFRFSYTVVSNLANGRGFQS